MVTFGWAIAHAKQCNSQLLGKAQASKTCNDAAKGMLITQLAGEWNGTPSKRFNYVNKYRNVRDGEDAERSTRQKGKRRSCEAQTEQFQFVYCITVGISGYSFA